MMEPELTADELYKAAQTVLVDEPDWGHRAVATAQLRKALWLRNSGSETGVRNRMTKVPSPPVLCYSPKH